MKKALATGLVVLSLVGSMSLPAFAAGEPIGSTGTAVSISEIHQKQSLTPEQKAEIEAKRKAWAEKFKDSQINWSALTDAQKNEIYDLIDKQIDIKIQTIDRMSASGVIDKDTADKMKARLTEQKANMRKSDEMPMFGFGKRLYKK